MAAWPAGNVRLDVDVRVGDVVSDPATTNFGIRTVTSRLKDGNLLFTVNGVDLLVLGGGYAPDLLQRRTLKERPNWQEDNPLSQAT